MYEHKIIKTNDGDGAITLLQKDGWGLCAINDGKMYFKKKITRSYNKIKEEDFPEWLQFKDIYSTINKAGIYDSNLIRKYKLKLEEGATKDKKKYKGIELHKHILGNMKKYKLHLECFKGKKKLMASTYINRDRFFDDWKMDKNYYDTKWKVEMMDEQKIPKDIKTVILTEASVYMQSNPNKEMTGCLFQRIIDRYFNPKYNKTNG